MLLERNLLKRVYVLSEEGRADRELLRTRLQMVEQRNDVARQIKSKLLFDGIRYLFLGKKGMEPGVYSAAQRFECEMGIGKGFPSEFDRLI
jgi:hypothetical protein